MQGIITTIYLLSIKLRCIYPEPICQTAHLHHNSCRPKQILQKTLGPGLPCRQWDGARTRYLAYQIRPCSSWKKTIIKMFYGSSRVTIKFIVKSESSSGQSLTSQRCPGRCLWSVRHRPWGSCSWCSCTEASSFGRHTGSSCEQIHWWTVQKKVLHIIIYSI